MSLNLGDTPAETHACTMMPFDSGAGGAQVREVHDPFHGDLLEVSMGPHHPSTHGVFRMMVTLDGERVTITPPALTRRACEPSLMQQEQDFTAALSRAFTYRLDVNRLELRSADGALQASFEPRVEHRLVIGDLVAARPRDVLDRHGQIPHLQRAVGNDLQHAAPLDEDAAAAAVHHDLGNTRIRQEILDWP